MSDRVLDSNQCLEGGRHVASHSAVVSYWVQLFRGNPEELSADCAHEASLLELSIKDKVGAGCSMQRSPRG